MHFSAFEGSNPHVRSFLSSLSQLTFAAMVDKTSEEEMQRKVSQFLARQGLSVRMAIQIVEKRPEEEG